MYSNTFNQKYFFTGMVFFILFLGAILYFPDFEGDLEHKYIKISIGIISFLINLFVVFQVRFIYKRRILAPAICTLLSISTLNLFDDLYLGLAYLLISLVLLFMLDVFPPFSKFKYFNAGLFGYLAAFLYPPVTLLVIFLFFATIFMYEKRANVFQYVAGIIIAVLLLVQIAYLIDQLPAVIGWFEKIRIPPFSMEFQLPALLLLGFILLYGLYRCFSESNENQTLDDKNKQLLLVFYLFFLMIIFALFMGSNYCLLAFASIPISIVISKSL